MKKKLVCIVVLCCTMLPVMAAESKTYRDYSKGYEGVAWVEFAFSSKNGIVTNRDGESLSLSEFCDLVETEIKSEDTFLGKKTKLTKEENFLIWSALNEYELLDGEVYSVAISTPPYVEGLSVLVVITDNGNGYTWYGGWRIKE